jgi:hypothetical protein
MADGDHSDDDDAAGTVRPSFKERLSKALLKPPPPKPEGDDGKPASVEELESAVSTMDDKERLIGLIVAPIAAAIAITVTGALIGNDPAARLADGAVNTRHVNPSLYAEVGAVLLVMSVLVLVFSLLRKRLFVGIVTALYGLAIFNLHYWGFGVPFLLVGAWYLVTAYRLQRDLKEATADGSGGTRRPARGSPSASRPQPSKRYTPPTAAPKRPTPPKDNDKDGDERRTG